MPYVYTLLAALSTAIAHVGNHSTFFELSYPQTVLVVWVFTLCSFLALMSAIKIMKKELTQ